MGNWLCRSCKMRVFLIGLEGVGTTSLLYHLKLGEIIYPTPTIGFNVEVVNIDGIEMTLWDVTSHTKVRILWRDYLSGSDGFVFVVDSTDRDSLSEVQHEFLRILMDDRTRNTMFMMVANKQDKEGAMSAQEIEDYLLNWNASYQYHTGLVVGCNALEVKQVNQMFTFYAHLLHLNKAGKLKRGLVTLKEQSEMKEHSEEPTFKRLLKSSLGYWKSFF